jgi:hypothetical protein
MARESSLWGRCNRAVKLLKKRGHAAHFCRLENSAGEGNPDVEGVLNGDQCWIELKSNDRPARATTVIRSKTRESQSIWHRERTEAGCRFHWVLIQVGEAHAARLYLIPGSQYDKIIATETVLAGMAEISPSASVPEILLRACEGW